MLDKYAEKVIAYHIEPVLTEGTFSIELQFAATPQGRAAARECLKECRRGHGKGGYVPQKKRQLNVTAKCSRRPRLQKNRMYRLRSGQLFWYFGLWDGHGNLVGKVVSDDQPFDDGVPLENKIIHRSELEQAELIPKGKEPWTT